MTDIKHRLSLNRFFPYRLTKLSGVISRTLAEQYSSQFDLTIHEWRIIAIVGEQPGLTARQVCGLASLDKVNISRAVDRLEKLGRIKRQVMPKDRRSFALFLTESGEQVLQQIIPLAEKFETKLLSTLNTGDQAHLMRLLDLLDEQADILAAGERKDG